MNRHFIKHKIIRDEINNEVKHCCTATASQILEGLQRNKPNEVEIKKFDKCMNPFSHNSNTLSDYSKGAK
jgi:hypothetical protein